MTILEGFTCALDLENELNSDFIWGKIGHLQGEFVSAFGLLMKTLIASKSAFVAWVWCLAIGASGWLLTGCAPIASIDAVTPPMPVAYVVNQSNDLLVKARDEVKTGDALAATDPKAAMARSEAAAMLSLQSLQNISGRRADEAIGLYNYATARLVEETIASGMKPWEKEVQLAGPAGPLSLILKPDSEGAYIPGFDRLLAADRMDIGGTYLTNRVRIEGIGAPFVSAGVGRNEAWAPNKHYYSVTAIITFSGTHGTIQILDPVDNTKINLADQERPVAADLTAPAALLITETQPQKFGISSLLHTDEFEKSAKLVMVGPYRTNRIPIIFIHGLGDSPVTWVPMINGLNSNPEFRQKYQVWVFRYPSGLPYPLSADLFRQYLTTIYSKYPNTPKAILIGHSMGGLVADMVIRDSNGQQYSQDVLGKPLDQFQIEADQLKIIQGSLVFKASPYISKVIFIATPHRGADMASNPIGRLGASLINLPANLVMMGPKLVASASASNGEKVVARFPNSIDTLRPEAKIVVAMNRLPISSSVTYYTILGDRGENDSPNSSDGVVAYRSSHLDGAQSEKIVPYWHSYVQRCPEAIAEVQRILLAQ
jgi:pimeloyl-ACP methyl ester carboxylesterase